MSKDPRTFIFAIDPGINGAWAVLNWTGEHMGCGELPRFEKALNAVELSNLFDGYAPEQAIIERVGAMPKQGVTSTFNFGVSYGMCRGVVAATGTPLTLVSPGRWKKHFGLIGKPKDASRQLATELFPSASSHLSLKKHVGRADALLLARYGFEMKHGRAPK
jgi:crossover junction endodeoxyribonuclease RuvC